MGHRDPKTFLPSLLDRIIDTREEQRAQRQAYRHLRRIEETLQALSEDETEARQRLLRERRDTLERLEQWEGSTRTWDDIRQCVRRDLEWLFNAHAYAPAADLEDLSECRRSVINFGIPDLTGTTASGLDVGELERRLAEAIAVFEPRILRRTLGVHLDAEASDLDHNSLVLEIEGVLWAEPAPIHLRLRTQLDLEEDLARVIEFQA